MANTKEISIGWYKDGIREGNWMLLDGENMSVKQSGWYKNKTRWEDMKKSNEFKNFTIYDVFIDPL